MSFQDMGSLQGLGGGGGIPFPASPSDGQVLTWNASTGQWEAAAAGGYPALDTWVLDLASTWDPPQNSYAAIPWASGTDDGSRLSSGEIVFGAEDEGTVWAVSAQVVFSSDAGASQATGTNGLRIAHYDDGDTLLAVYPMQGVSEDPGVTLGPYILQAQGPAAGITVAEGDYLTVEIYASNSGVRVLSGNGSLFSGRRIG